MDVLTRMPVPTSDSLTNVLVQGLQSRDNEMLENVLNNSDERVIRNTIKKLPIDCISMLLSELQTRLFTRSEHTIIYAKWMEQLLSLKLAFLLTLPNIEEDFGPMLEILNARTRVLERIYRLKGRLNLMISQVRTQTNTTALSRNKPQITYESSSSGEESEDMMDDRLIDSDGSDEELNSIKDEDEVDPQSSDESIDGDDALMSDDIDDEREEDYDSTKVNGIETD